MVHQEPIGFFMLIFIHSQSRKTDWLLNFSRKEGNHMTKCKVIALANQKGGTAKTTTTLNLGIGLVHQGRKVLLVDADPQGDLTTALGWTDADNLPITLDTQMKKILQDEPFVYNEGILHHKEGVDIIPTNIELSGMEISLVNAMSREQTLKLYLSNLKKDYDYILIDCMPSLGMLTINALAVADSVIVPVQAHYLPLKGISSITRNWAVQEMIISHMIMVVLIPILLTSVQEFIQKQEPEVK